MSYAGRIKAGMAYIEITTDNSKLARGLVAAQSALKNFGISVQAVGGDLLRLTGMMSIPLAMSVKTFADFDDQMRTVQAITRATNDELKNLTDTAEELGATTAFTTTQVAEGMVSLARMGFSAGQVNKAIEPVLKLVRATGTEMFRLGDVSMYAAAVMRDFKIPAEEMADVCDVLTYAANNSAMDIFDLGEAIKIIGPTAYSVDDSFRNVSAELMTLANAGIKGSLAGTSLRKVYQALAHQTSEEATQLRELGVALKNVNGNLRRPMDVLRDLSVAVQKMKSGEKINFTVDVFDLRGSLGALSLLPTTKETKSFRDALDDVNGIAGITAAKIENGLGGALRMLWSRFQALQIIVGRAIDESFRDAIVSFIAMLDSVRKWVCSNKQLVAQLALVVAGAAAAGVALVALGLSIKIVANAIGGMIIAFKALTAVILLPVNALILLHNVINGIIGILSALVTGIVAIGGAFASVAIAIKAFATSAFFAKTAMLVLLAGVGAARIVILSLMGATIAAIAAMRGIMAVSTAIVSAMKAMSGVVLTVGIVLNGVKTAILAVGAAFRTIYAVISGVVVAFNLLRSAIVTFNATAIAGKAVLVGFGVILKTAAGFAVGLQVTFAGFTYTMKAMAASSLAASVAVKIVSAAFTTLAATTSVIRGTMAATNAIIATSAGVFAAVKTAIIGFAATIGVVRAAIVSFVASGAALRGIIAAITGTFAVIQGVVAGAVAAFALLRSAMVTFSATAMVGKAAVVGLGAIMMTAKGVAIALQVSFAWFTVTMKAMTTSLLAANIATKIVSVTFTAIIAVMNAVRAVMAAGSIITLAWAAVLKTVSFVGATISTVFKAVKAAVLGFNIAAAASTGIVAAFNAVLAVGKAIVAGFSAVLGLLKIIFLAVAGAATTGWAAVLGPIVAIGAIVGVAVVAIQALSGAFDILWGAMKEIGNGFVAAFGNIKKVAGEAFGIVKDALHAGDTAGAAKVALSALYIIWLEGIAPLKKAWSGLKSFLCDSWTIIKSVVLKAANNLWYGLLYGLKVVGNSIADTWNKVWDGIISTFESTIAWLKKKWIQFKGFFDSDVNVDAEIRRVDQEIAENKTEHAKRTNASVAERQAELDKLGNEWETSNQAIDDKMVADIAASAREYNDALGKASSDLEAARKNYEDAKNFAAMWKTMQSAVKDLQRVFDESGEDYRMNLAHKDTEAQKEREKVDEVAKQDPSKAQDMMREIIAREKEKARIAKEEFEKALKEAQADRVIDPQEKAKLEGLSAAYGRASELEAQYKQMLQSGAEGTSDATNVGKKAFGSFSLKILDQMIGGNSMVQERTARAAEESVKQQKETNKHLEKLRIGSTALIYI